MTQISSQTRIEPDPRDVSGLPRAAQVPVADPAWMLSRQWWMGEMTGHNGGTPLRARIDTVVERLTYSDGEPDACIPSALLADPLPVSGSDHPRASFALGRRLLVQMQTEITGLAAVIEANGDPTGNLSEILSEFRRRLGSVHEAFPLKADSPALRRVPKSRQVDGLAALDAVLRDTDSAGRLFSERTRNWLRSQQPLAGADFQVETATHSRDVSTLTSDARIENAPGPRLHWSDLRGGQSDDIVPQSQTTALVRASFEGDAPASWWGMEEAGRNWAAAPAGPSDLGQLLIAASFATVGQGLWLCSVDAPTNALVQIGEVVLIDGFGRETSARQSQVAAQSAWTDATRERWLPLLADAPLLLGDATDMIAFGLDSAANLVWGEERIAPNADGRGQRTNARASERTVTELNFALRIPPPATWHPYIVTDGGTLLRRPLARQDGTGQVTAHELQSDLSPAALDLAPAQIDPAGFAVQRRWVIGRAPDGSRQLWRVRGNARAALSGSAGLAHDMVLRPEA